MTTIDKLLIANRAEIARRIMRTCRAMGIRTVAVYSDADANAPHVVEADEAVRIGPAPSVESYLVIDAIIEAAKKTNADAIHPGYGFLAENAALSQACADANLIFVGPYPDAIRSMGSKREAKKLVAAAGVPVIPGYAGEDQSDETLLAEAKKIEMPVLVKASAGGGGKGMRIVHDGSELSEAIAGARREAASAFGDDTLLIEKYIDDPRHVEIQILGDHHGNLVHVFERECSIQRRHQKIIEETPSPAVNAELRAKMGSAAVEIAKAIGYENAGTVEFVLAPSGQFYFLEVNTRLQVEHPITECVTGLDLVQEQIRVAEGNPLPFTQDDLQMKGAAIECRIYAEDPNNGFLPATGEIVDWHLPELRDVRVDSGVESGSEVGIHYDPMLAKIVARGDNRKEAIRRMTNALERLSAAGVTTNRAFLIAVLAHPEFGAGKYDTHFIDRHADALFADERAADRERIAAVATTLAMQADRARAAALPSAQGYRNSRFSDQWVEYGVGEDVVRVEYHPEPGAAFQVTVGDWSSLVKNVDWSAPGLSFEDGDGVRQTVRVIAGEKRAHTLSALGATTLTIRPRFPERTSAAVSGGCLAPMPGKVIDVRVEPGATVAAGDVLVLLEAMKMEHAVRAPGDGTVEAVHVEVGQQVEADAVMVVLS